MSPNDAREVMIARCRQVRAYSSEAITQEVWHSPMFQRVAGAVAAGRACIIITYPGLDRVDVAIAPQGWTHPKLAKL